MARINTNAELWHVLTEFGYMYDSTGAATNLTSTVAAGSSSLSVAGTTQFSTGAQEYIRIGPSGGSEVGRVETFTTVAITLVSQTALDHSSGTILGPVQILQRVNLGDISDAGVTLDVETDRTPINVATRRHRYATHTAHSNYRGSVQLENISMENLLTAMGIDESLLHGAGTVADPTVADWTPDLIDSVDPVAFYAVGALKDGTVVEVQWFDCDWDPTKTWTIARGQDAPLDFAFDAQWMRIINPAG
jgi:hypothetical protein